MSREQTYATRASINERYRKLFWRVLIALCDEPRMKSFGLKLEELVKLYRFAVGGVLIQSSDGDDHFESLDWQMLQFVGSVLVYDPHGFKLKLKTAVEVWCAECNLFDLEWIPDLILDYLDDRVKNIYDPEVEIIMMGGFEPPLIFFDQPMLSRFDPELTLRRLNNQT
jgi:hypothetical protein